jgi:hypothetical protein
VEVVDEASGCFAALCALACMRLNGQLALATGNKSRLTPRFQSWSCAKSIRYLIPPQRHPPVIIFGFGKDILVSLGDETLVRLYVYMSMDFASLYNDIFVHTQQDNCGRGDPKGRQYGRRYNMSNTTYVNAPFPAARSQKGRFVLARRETSVQSFHIPHRLYNYNE